ncbi:hypothetical protein EYF80_060799 [Liparis tanakae]|uniref:Uncharacterized protein n=1 Tax=Liparis tanakae TaxID=230148 RepID=A0A4Z2EKR4_9TELE|nr:hypothetical protein EYF80_060799 [Liparis tanakae]
MAATRRSTPRRRR